MTYPLDFRHNILKVTYISQNRINNDITNLTFTVESYSVGFTQYDDINAFDSTVTIQYKKSPAAMTFLCNFSAKHLRYIQGVFMNFSNSTVIIHASWWKSK